MPSAPSKETLTSSTQTPQSSPAPPYRLRKKGIAVYIHTFELLVALCVNLFLWTDYGDSETGHIQVNHGRIVHHTCVVIPREEIPCSTHVRSQLISLLELDIEDFRPTAGLRKSAMTKSSAAVELKSGISNQLRGPSSLLLSAFNQVAANKSTGTTDECIFHLP